MNPPQEITFSCKVAMFGFNFQWPFKAPITAESLMGKNIHNRPCPVCEGKKHGIDSCSKVKSVSYDDQGTVTAIELDMENK